MPTRCELGNPQNDDTAGGFGLREGGPGEVRSRGLSTLRAYLAAYAASPAFTTLTAEREQVHAGLAAITYTLHIRGSRITVARYDGEPDYAADVEATFAKFRRGDVKNYRAKFRDWVEMNHVEAAVLDRVALLQPDAFAALDRYCDRHRDFLDPLVADFDREVQFYVAYLEYVRRLGDFARVEEHLRRLRLDGGALVSARLGKGGKGVGYVLRKPRTTEPLWRQWLAPLTGESPYTVVIAERDEAGMQALTELRGQGIDAAANALHQSADHILAFFAMLRAELGFYVGCLNLRDRLAGKSEPLCFSEPLPPGRPALAAHGLYDACLSLSVEGRVVGNDVEADGKTLVVITGANRGGKSTFLRSVGLAQLMTQAGMFVAAESFRADTRTAVFTHFRREEDATMTSGKLDEELSRMSGIVDQLAPRALVLFNESFSATNEREGAEIARAVVRALLEAGVKVCFVTHSFELARGFQADGADDALFLRAERRPDGTRTFKVVEGEPLPTSFGPDLYRRIFGEPDSPGGLAGAG